MTRWRVLGLALGLFAGTGSAVAAQSSPHVLVIRGLGGDDEYRTLFSEWGEQLVDAARAGGVPDERIVYLAERPESDPTRIDGPSRREDVDRWITTLAERAGPGDPVLVVLIGHGSYNDGVSAFNLPGRDLTAEEFAELLARFGDRPLVFVNTASASGEFVGALSGPGRTVITATKTGAERNQTRFGGYFVAALAGEDADADKDGRISALEAFEYARRETARSYESENRLMTEHALLDDDADGEGSEEPSGEGDGALAASIFLTALPGGRAVRADPETDDPVLLRLYQDRDALEGQVAALRARRDTMEARAYEAELERLLVELGLKNREIRAREGGG